MRLYQRPSGLQINSLVYSIDFNWGPSNQNHGKINCWHCLRSCSCFSVHIRRKLSCTENGHLLKENGGSLQRGGLWRQTEGDKRRERKKSLRWKKAKRCKSMRGFCLIENYYGGFLTQSITQSSLEDAAEEHTSSLIHMQAPAAESISLLLHSDYCVLPPSSPGSVSGSEFSCRAAVVCHCATVWEHEKEKTG